MKLNKWKNTIADRNFRNETNENWAILESTYTGVEEKSNEALESSKTAKEKSAEANEISKNVQEQLNTIVIAGDSGPEAAQARTDAKGNTSDTLKERLDIEQIQRLEFQDVQMKSKFDNKFELIAHRGFGKLFPENTVTAAKSAIQLGADSLEFDMQMTSDGVPVIIHDETVDRTTNGSGKVVEKSFLDLRQLDAAKNFPYFSGEKIPSLEEMLRFAKGSAKYIYPEIKGYRQQSDIKIMIDLIVKYGLDTRCVISSAYPPNLQYVRTINKQLTLGFSVDTIESFYVCLDLAKEDRNSILMCNGTIIFKNPNLVKVARDSGVDFVVWTVETLEYMQRIKTLGVNRFVTDYYIKGL